MTMSRKMWRRYMRASEGGGGDCGPISSSSLQSTSKKSRRQKRAAKKAEEEHLYMASLSSPFSLPSPPPSSSFHPPSSSFPLPHTAQTERALLDDSRAPETAEDYERLLLSHPNSSAVWVQYMAFLLHTAEVDKARSVGERALQAISFR